MRRIHMALDIQGALRHSDRALAKMFNEKNGFIVRQTLKLELAKGHLVYPMDGCDNFDPIKGCLGHEEK